MSNFARAAIYYKQLPHQTDAFDYAWSLLTEEEKTEFLRRWRNEPRLAEKKDILLNVPYFSQRDNYTQPDRTCNSSACAMALKYFRPKSISDDDDYLRTVLKYGDTTSHSVQTTALNFYGLKSSFHLNLSFDDLDRELEQNRPVVIGILHRGTDLAPSGGHMVVVIGVNKNRDTYICHDPWGKGFQYYDKNGANVEYTKKQLRTRWTISTPNDGWGRLFHP